MSYSADILTNKLSQLNDTQQSIVSISQWVLFHQRHVVKTAEVWARYTQDAIQDAPQQVLPLIYLANDIVQQARAKRKTEFLTHFATHLPAVLAAVCALGALDAAQRLKLERVVGVWDTRRIFEHAAQRAIHAAVGSAEKRVAVAGPPEWEAASTSLAAIAAVDVASFNARYDSTLNAEHLPAPSVFLPALRTLLTQLADAEKRLAANVTARTDAVLKIRTWLEAQELLIAADQQSLAALLADGETSSKKDRLAQMVQDLTEMEQQAVEDEPEAPEVEAFTPPPSPKRKVPAPEEDAVPQYEANSDSDSDNQPLPKRAKVESVPAPSTPEVTTAAPEPLAETSPDTVTQKYESVFVPAPNPETEVDVDVTDLLNKLG